jgi:hypothetical protein
LATNYKQNWQRWFCRTPQDIPAMNLVLAADN